MILSLLHLLLFIPQLFCAEVVPGCPQTFETIREKLEIRIYSRAMKQMQITGPVRLNWCCIENWPPFVPTRSDLWDEQAVMDLEIARPKLIFKLLPSFQPEKERQRSIEQANNKTKLLVILLDIFNKQTKFIPIKLIPWPQTHLHGWPVQVPSSPGGWKALDLLKIYRNLHCIRFELMSPGERRVIWYDDGTLKRFKDPIKGNKRKLGSDVVEGNEEMDKLAISWDDSVMSSDISFVDNDILVDDKVLDVDDKNFKKLAKKIHF